MLLEQFKETVRDRHRIAKERKDQLGKMLMGWICNYIPEELIHAAGMYPVRIFGGQEETARADAHLYTNICSFTRSCLEEGFKGSYSYLDGLVTASTCDHMRRIYDAWRRYLKTSFVFQIGLPHKVTEDSIDYYKGEITELKEGLEKVGGKKVTNDLLYHSIALYNKTRSLLRDIYDLRRANNPPISGADSLDVVVAGMILPREEYNLMLEDLLKNLRTTQVPADSKPRLMLTGSELDDSEYIKVIEELGAIVVTDSLCTGSRYFWDMLDISGDPMDALARYYMIRTPCPRWRPFGKRLEHLKELATSFDVDGAICEMIKFCDNAGEEYPMVKEALDEIGVPSLVLQREYNLSGVGQMKTRIQAFLESIGG